MKKKTVAHHREEVTYDSEHWELLKHLREESLPVMESLSMYCPIVYGSVARGDVHKGSDIDIFIPATISSYILEIALERFGIVEKVIAMATPWHLIKSHIVLSNGITVTFPLVEFKKYEREFYYFGGAVAIDAIKEGRRVPGIDKRLMLIQPTEGGHIGMEVQGNESLAAKTVGVPLGLVRERQQVLNKRDKVGRTGIYLNKHLLREDNIELELKRLADTDTNIKRRYRA
ncbi:MAG TPA: nucleotidyltransferase domain-containing protein [Candidatus Methanofastidiosa archaeon]|nr:nucleotidyltransferase domain-containing protein [Candidatus Methanofastidiosa archaeon]